MVAAVSRSALLGVALVAVLAVVASLESRKSLTARNVGDRLVEASMGRHLDRATKLQNIVDAGETSADPKVQDGVALARMQLAYMAADQGDFDECRSLMLKAADEYRGAGASQPGYGQIDDNARYQAIVALEAKGDRAGAVNEYLEYLKTRPLSPLCKAVHGRLLRLDVDAQTLAKAEELLDSATGQQARRARRDAAMCGPKAVVRMLQELHVLAGPLSRVAEACGTDDSGTSMAGLQSALLRNGVKTVGMKLNRRDFYSARTPFVFQHRDHFVLVLSVGRRSARVYDPMLGSDSEIGLPPLEDPDFEAVTLVPTN